MCLLVDPRPPRPKGSSGSSQYQDHRTAEDVLAGVTIARTTRIERVGTWRRTLLRIEDLDHCDVPAGVGGVVVIRHEQQRCRDHRDDEENSRPPQQAVKAGGSTCRGGVGSHAVSLLAAATRRNGGAVRRLSLERLVAWRSRSLS